MHATPLLSSRRPPTSGKPVQSTFQHARRPRRRGLAASPPCTPIVVNKKNCPASMICVTILRSFFSSILQVRMPKNAKTTRSLKQRRAEAARRRRSGTFLRHWASFSRKTADAKHLLGEALPSRAYDFLIRHHTHCLSPGVALTLPLSAAGR
jgi:hypothetical protein